MPGEANPHLTVIRRRRSRYEGIVLRHARGCWLAEADPPELDLLREEAARLAAILGTELDLNVSH